MVYLKKLIYLAPVDKHLIGIWKKINMQIDFFKKNNIDVKLINTNDKMKQSILGKINRKLPFTGLYRWDISLENISKVDCIYIRYQASDYQLIRMLKNIKKSNSKIKILVEIPTYPYDNEIILSFKNFPIVMKDRWNRKKLFKLVNRVITFSNDEEIFNISTIVLSNAVNVEKTSVKKITCPNEDINVIAVANYVFWHGYDRFIRGMHEYYSRSLKHTKINLYMVGGGDEIEKYKKLVDLYNLQSYVKFCGKMDGKDLDEIYNKCEIGLDAMGRHRSEVFYNSSLKGKEYGAKGIPIVSGVETELDSDRNYKYYLRVPADESNINMEIIIDFYDKIYNSTESKEEVIANIRNYTESHFDVSVTWAKVVHYIKGETDLKYK